MPGARSATAALCSLILAVAAGASTLNRDRDPVVMTGADLTSLAGIAVDRIVAFRYESGWIQIPVQIDERDVVDFGTVYDQAPVGLLTLAYTDPDTYAGADSDPTFDDDDELVFMAHDAGARAPTSASLPPGVVGGQGLELEIGDPLDAGVGYVYLFETDGTLPPGAGANYGTYTFNLLAGPYIPNYNTLNGPNPEDSEFVSPLYRSHFSDRWIRDELNVTAGGSSGADILDRHKNMFGPGICQRTEDTFSNGEGAFFANIDGPVRSIRSYMGANSGPLTQRDHIFYAGRQDVTTFLRVHAIPGVMDVYDYSPSAVGMSYFNDLDTLGVAVDGVPDAIVPGAIEWEMVTGAQGSLVVVHSVVTDIPGFAYTSYYSDDSTPSVAQCTGDAFEYATSGLWIDQLIPNTDPSQGAYNVLTARRVVYYEGPGQGVQDAVHRRDQASTSLSITTAPFVPETPDCSDGVDNDGDGLADFPDDPGCADAADLSEDSPLLPCDDGADNDGDGYIDFQVDPVLGDPGCRYPSWLREDPQCQDGVDNDGQRGTDFDGGESVLGDGNGDPDGPDPQCLNKPWHNREKARTCGLGHELALALAPLFWLHRRRRRASA